MTAVATTVEQIVTYGRQELVIDSAVAARAEVNIFGCGTVGSNVAAEVVKLGVKRVNLYDYDEVEGHNVPSQRFLRTDIGRPKTEALAEHLDLLGNDVAVKTYGKITGPLICKGIGIIAVDSMAARKLIWEKIVSKMVGMTLAIDFRMSGNVLQVYALNPRDKDQAENYPASLFEDKDAEPAPCGGRTVSYTGALSGAMGGNYVRKHLAAQPLPYFWSMDMDALEQVKSEDE